MWPVRVEVYEFKETFMQKIVCGRIAGLTSVEQFASTLGLPLMPRQLWQSFYAVYLIFVLFITEILLLVMEQVIRMVLLPRKTGQI
jgi:hypothetical protein